MKLWSSVKGAGEKAAFEAQRMVRVQQQEAAAGEVRKQLQAKQASLGQIALGLYKAGQLTDSSIAAVASEIGVLEAKEAEIEAGIAAIKAEQFKGSAPAPAPAAPAYTPPPAPAPVQEAPAPEAPAAPAEEAKARFCPNCGKPVPGGAGFCPECGTKMGASA